MGDAFPDFKLPDNRQRPRRLSGYTRPSLFDENLGFDDGYPIIVVFGRGFFCPRDQEQMRGFVRFQPEVAVSADPPMVGAAGRAGLGTEWPILSDERREVIRRLNILDETEGQYAGVSRPFTFVLRPDLTVHKIYDGWFLVGRPTFEELRRDLRGIMESRKDYSYEAYDTPEARRIRIPQREGADGAAQLGANGPPVARGSVSCFDVDAGVGKISPDSSDEVVFFGFTAIPGEGCRTLIPGTPVCFEVVENVTGPTARNVQERPA